MKEFGMPQKDYEIGLAQGPGAQGMPTAQGPASTTDANALALIHDDTIIHISIIPNPVMCLFDS